MLHRQHRVGFPPVAIAPKTTNRGGRVHPFTNEQNRRLRAVRSAAAVALLARRDRRRNGWVGRTGRRGTVENGTNRSRGTVRHLPARRGRRSDRRPLADDVPGRVLSWRTSADVGHRRSRSGPLGHQGEAARCPRVRAYSAARRESGSECTSGSAAIARPTWPNRRENRSRRGLRR